MNFVFLSPHFPTNYRLFCRSLRRRGAQVLGIGDTPPNALPTDLKNALTEYFPVRDMDDYDQVLRAVGYLTHQYGKISRIESHNEHWLGLESSLRTDFNVEGPHTKDLPDIKLKSRMKQKFIEAGLQVVKGERILDEAHCRTFIERVGYPVVIKPDQGVGANDTFRIDNEDQLERFLNEEDISDYFIEEFVDGKICTFDGLTNAAGEPVFFTGHEYSHGVMEVVNNDGHVAYCSYREIPKDLEEAGRKLLKAFNVKERFFHFEFFRRHHDQALIVLEVNIRPPGGMTLDMFNFANDIDIYDVYAELIMTGTTNISYNRPYHCAYISRKNHINYRHSHEEISKKLRMVMRYEGPIHKLFSRGMGHYAYIIATPYMEEVNEAIDFIHQTK
ncbi:MAG: ATP-grasp domain-containing protein [Myxococcales bacterium]|nr:ATP-grasp domain-containing protein [Myxococcales bacterium]MCB9644430.1 ATP-grasp domain-containing protein [Myxococcales bacterium]